MRLIEQHARQIREIGVNVHTTELLQILILHMEKNDSVKQIWDFIENKSSFCLFYEEYPQFSNDLMIPTKKKAVKHFSIVMLSFILGRC